MKQKQKKKTCKSEVPISSNLEKKKSVLILLFEFKYSFINYLLIFEFKKCTCNIRRNVKKYMYRTSFFAYDDTYDEIVKKIKT